MENPRVSIVAALGKNRELGRGNDLIWRIKEDLGRVKRLTMGHPIVMGRNTYESIGHPLPGRTNIVISSAAGDIPGCIVAPSLEAALAAARATGTDEVFIFGGARVYKDALPLTDRLYLTLVDGGAADADVFFPDYADFTTIIEEERHDEHEPPFRWVTLERPASSSV
ncbi:MAG TPA: dihydrofolate reductase [Candidatus Paceibacterota bacterium]|nr:dihydrofolate reductase [Candidatus Paceibacterota bacterium]